LPADSSRAPAAGEQRWGAAVTAASSAEVLKPDVLASVYERTAKKIKEHFAHVPEELRLKKIELNRAKTRVHNFIEFIAAGRATPGLADALGQAEEQVKALTVDMTSMESAKDHGFTPPPRAWIEGRVKNLNELLAARVSVPRGRPLPYGASRAPSRSRRRSARSGGRTSRPPARSTASIC
jgi:hypothetical protein